MHFHWYSQMYLITLFGNTINEDHQKNEKSKNISSEEKIVSTALVVCVAGRLQTSVRAASDLPSSSESTTDHCTPPKTSPLQKICMHRGVQGTCRTAPCCIKPHLHQAPAYAPAGVWGTSTKTLHSHAAPNWWRHQQVKEEERRRGGAWGGKMGASEFSRKVLLSPTFNHSWSRSNTSPIFCFWSFSCLFLSLITACTGHTR